MIKLFIIIFLINIPIAAQAKDTDNDFLSPGNVKKFADYLFCQHDYLRSVEEYKRYLKSVRSDTVRYLIGEAYSIMGDYPAAAANFKLIVHSQGLGGYARLNYLKSYFQANDFKQYRKMFKEEHLKENDTYYPDALSLYNFSFLMDDGNLPGRENFLKSFDMRDRKTIGKFYEFKSDPPYKSPVKAAVLSAIIPGAGKFYTHEYADGITAFLTTGILSYIAYTDFHAGYKFRGWLFVSLASGFYAGNVYGSAASAQIFNAKLRFDFTQELKNFLTEVNFFIPQFNYCR